MKIDTKLLSVFVMLVALGFLSRGASAQVGPTDNSEADIKIGARGGIAQANLQGSAVSSADSRTGFVGGVYATFQVNEFLAIQPEASYISSGSSSADIDARTQLDGVEFEQNEIQVPILFKVGAPVGSVSPRLLFGPSLNFSLNPDLNDERRNEDFDGPFFGIVVGGEVGLGLDLAGGIDEVALDGRYNLGVSEIAGDTINFTDGVKSESFTVTLNVRFDL